MQGLGFVHDRLDIKVLILFVMSRINYPATDQQIYELCLQDNSVSYFEVMSAIPQLVKSGHLLEKDTKLYEITEKGRADGELTQDSIAYTVRCRAENAVLRFNRQLHRSTFVKTKIISGENDCTVVMSLNDETGNLMKLELMAPNQRQAMRLSELYEAKAEIIYNMIMAELLETEDENGA